MRRTNLNALRAFEATVRHGSMTAAAAELLVTHGAVSRHVKALELELGQALLHRKGRAVTPSAEGAALAAEVTASFERIQLALARVRPRQLTLSCSATIMLYWLMPRLGAFKQAHPGLELRLNVNYGEVDFIRDEVSVAIRNSMYRPPPSAVAETLRREEIGPVCHPDYAARHGLAAPEDLPAARLLGSETRPLAWAEWDRAMGRDAGCRAPDEVFGHFYLAIQAAACGLGVAVVPRLLVEDEIAAGHLVAPLGFVPGPHRLELWIARHLRGRPEVQALGAWLRAQMGPAAD